MTERTGPRVIVALDFPDRDAALHFVRRVQPNQCRLKVGLELFTAAGPGLIAALHDSGFEVFLDLKFHDIPHTVRQACRRAAALGVWMLNVHALGGPAMLAAAREAVEVVPRRPRLIAVTLLTSHTDADLRALGIDSPASEAVVRLARLTHAAGLDGVVCSPREADALRRRFGVDFLRVTPGIRPAGAAHDDQARIATPRAALAAGANYLVIGRPITQAPDPAAALARINDEIGAG